MKTCLTREVLMAVNCATFPLETSFCGSFRGQSHFGIRNLLSLIFLHKREDGPWLILPAVKDNCHKDWGGATGRSTDCGIRWGGLKPVQPLFSCGRRLVGFFFFFFFFFLTILGFQLFIWRTVMKIMPIWKADEMRSLMWKVPVSQTSKHHRHLKT